jgi:hypothetical protein
MTQAISASSTRVGEFLKKMQTPRGRLIFALDATASRQPTWDTACQLQAEMFHAVATIGGLEIQLAYYRSVNECRAGRWTSDTYELANSMTKIMCMAGYTQIGKILTHVRKEHAQKHVNAVVFVGDAMEETPHSLYDAAAGLGVPVFIFQEGSDPYVEKVFKEISVITKGTYAKFGTGSARELADLLRAVATFAVGGTTALADLRTDGARKLLGQLK